jgi:DNA primase small subunit
MPHSESGKETPTDSPMAEETPQTVDEEMDDAEEVDAVGSGASSAIGTATPEETSQESAPAVKQEGDIKMKLEDMFDDLSSDEEYPTSALAKSKLTSSQPEAPASPINLAQAAPSDENVQRQFYQRLFPWRYLFQWLNHGPIPSNDFAHREFAFTLQNDAYLRYQSYPTADLMRKDVLRLNPSRFEIGPVYTTNPRERKTLRKQSSFKPLSKELCFDIDLTDYDEIRTCCDKANICKKCWQFMNMAIKVVDTALKEDFGFKHIMWVYSGRRGVHAWVCDKKARTMDDVRRRAVAGYFEVIKGGSQAGKKVNVKRPLHPHVAYVLTSAFSY